MPMSKHWGPPSMVGSNRSIRRLLRLAFIATALVAIAHGARAACAANLVTIQDPGTFVVDEAHLLRPDTKQSLEDLLAKLQEATTDQVKVLTVPTLGGEDLFDFSQRHYQL